MRSRQPVDPAQAQAADAPAPQGDAARRGRGRRTERQTHRPTASDADLRLLVETVQDYGIVLLDPDGNVASWNAGAQRIRGYEAAEVIGQPISRLYPAGDPAGPQLESLLQRARDEGRCVFEGWQLRKDGSRFWANVVITALRDDTGALRGYSEITRDRNDRRRLEEMLRSVVDHVVDGIITIDEHGTVESFNPAAERLFKLSRDQIIGRNVNELMPEPFRSGHDEYIRNYTQGGPAKIIGIGREVSGRRADGTTFPMELAVSEFQIASRRFFTGIVRDITQRKQLEHELRQRVDDLAEADRQKNDFLAMLAHELRNPLAPMRNAAHLMKMKGVTVGMAVQAREMLERQLEHLVRLVDDLLDVSRIVQGRIELRREPVDLALVVARAVETAHPVIEARGHRLALDFPERPIYVEGDLIRLAQVIANLLTNAAKYAERPGEICVSAQREAGHAVVRVRDTGIGIAPELLPRIFDLFVQGPQTLVRTQGGLGIGLTLVRRLVELHGGTVSVSSEGNGKGSEFTIRLPLAPIDADSRDLFAPPIQPRVSDALRRRVLVVDDNVDAAESIAMILRLSGYDVRCAYDGESCLAAAPQFRPDVVVLDIGLPGINGYDVARQLRQHPALGAVALVALTGYGQDADRSRARDAGFDHHLTKPVDPELLQALVAPQQH